MLTPEQTEKIKKVIESEEKTLYINTGPLIEIAEVLGLDGGEWWRLFCFS